MTVDDLRTLFAYDRWADDRMLAVAESLPAGASTRVVESSFPSLLATLIHIVEADWVWLRRWQGESPTALPDWWPDPVSVADARRARSKIESERSAFVASLDDETIGRTLAYRTFDGTPYRTRLADCCLHVVNHASYHRGQLTTIFRQLGASPPATDYVLFLREWDRTPESAG